MAEYCMYIILNSSLKMGKGKMVAQGCHVASNVTKRMLDHYKYTWDVYIGNGIHPKIVLKGDQETMEIIKNKYSYNLNEIFNDSNFYPIFKAM
jgi:peptidyl-tRNA hydrolase